MECYRRSHRSREHRPNRHEFDMYHPKGNRGVRRDRKWSRYRERMARRHVRIILTTHSHTHTNIS